MGEVIKKDELNGTLSESHFETDDSIVTFVETLYDETKRIKWPFERTWFININFYLGRQYVIANDRQRKFEVPNDPPHKVRHVSNRIASFVRTKIAKLSRSEPVPEVSSATSDFTDFQKARLCEALISYWNNKLKMQDMLSSEMMLWQNLTGNAFLRPFWDKGSGPVTVLDKEGVDEDVWSDFVKAKKKKPTMPDEEAKSVEEVKDCEGDVGVICVSPFSLAFHPNAKTVEESLWALESNVRDMDTIRETWGDAADGVTEDSDGDWRDYESRLLGNEMTVIMSDPKKARFPKVVEKQFWVRPCRLFPKGKYVVVAGHKLLYKGDFPFDHGKLPYVQFKDMPVPNRLWGRAQIEDLIPIQKQINAKLSRFAEVFNLHAMPKWLVAKGSGVDEDALTNSPAEVINHNPNMPPVPHVPPPMPGYAQNLIDRDMGDFDEVSGQREATRGMAPGRVDSASGIAQLQEADDNQLAPLDRHIGEKLAECYSQMLSIAHQYYTEKRLIKIVGAEGRVEVREFKGTDLAGGESFNGQFDVRLYRGSGLPLSRGGRAQLVATLLEKNLLGPSDKEMVMRVLELGGPKDAIFKSVELARSQAHIENADMAAGIQHSVNTWDDHAEHKKVHNEFRRRPEFLVECEKDPDLNARVEQHVKWHDEAEAVQSAYRNHLNSIAGPPPAVPAAAPQGAPPGAPMMQM